MSGVQKKPLTVMLEESAIRRLDALIGKGEFGQTREEVAERLLNVMLGTRISGPVTDRRG